MEKQNKAKQKGNPCCKSAEIVLFLKSFNTKTLSLFLQCLYIHGSLIVYTLSTTNCLCLYVLCIMCTIWPHIHIQVQHMSISFVPESVKLNPRTVGVYLQHLPSTLSYWPPTELWSDIFYGPTAFTLAKRVGLLSHSLNTISSKTQICIHL